MALDSNTLFKPLEWQSGFLNDVSPIALLTGSAGGGKSRVAAQKAHSFAKQYPNMTLVVARKIEKDCLKSSYQMLKREVVKKSDHVKFKAREAEYPNGSVIYFIGMYNERAREAVRSIGPGHVDYFWMEEGHEFDEEDFDEALGRMRGKGAGWNQLVISTNPDAPLHWIYRRLIVGEEASVHYSRESDNPHNHESYKARLAEMRGVKGLRLRDGKWVQGSGIIYETWTDKWDAGHDTGNVTSAASFIPGIGNTWIFADDGYSGRFDKKAKMFTQNSHPRVLLFAQKHHDGRIAVIDEMYKVGTREDVHIAAFKRKLSKAGHPWPSAGIFDSAAPSLGAALRDSGVRSVWGGTKNLDNSVSVLRDRLAPDENDWRQVIVNPQCRFLRMEMVSWSYNRRGGYNDFFDNGPDAMRYGVYHLLDPVNASSELDVSVTGTERSAIDDLMHKIDVEWDKYMGDLGL